ncbi:MAG: HAMP domain-containing sensor histidine kinase, partial [Ferruginibacter sp.]
LRKELYKIQKEQQKMIEVEITFTFPFIGERIISFNMQPISRENGEQLILLALDDITLVRNAALVKEQKKDDFISIASHEMKTPLTTAKAYLQLLEMSLDKSDETARLYATKASQSVTRLNELITELLDVSKIQYGKLNYNITTFDFNEMVSNTVEDMQYSSPKHTLIKKGTVKLKMTGDRDRIQQVLINLLTNAIKYSPDAGKILIEVQQANNEIIVSVKDNGIGIPKHHLEKIFDRYYRVEDHAVQFQGLGIGLFICHEIIERHHGKLWAESEMGKGSTFSFSLPAEKK